jgi:hypothetical protein
LDDRVSNEEERMSYQSPGEGMMSDERIIDKQTARTYKLEALRLRRERLDKNETAREVAAFARAEANREEIEHVMRNETGEK